MTTPPYKNKQYYKGVTNDKTHDSHTHKTGVSRSDDDSLARNLDAENKNTEDDEYNYHPSIKKYKIDSQSHEKIRKRLLLNLFSLKVIDLVLFNIDNNENDILAVDLQNKKIESKDKWNKMNLLDMQSLLGTNCCMPLLNISKSYIWIEKTNQRIDEFSIGYMMNPNLNRNRAFKDQVKVCLKKTFGPDTNTHIAKRLSKNNTRVLALVIFYEIGKKIIRKLLRVSSCVIYNQC